MPITEYILLALLSSAALAPAGTSANTSRGSFDADALVQPIGGTSTEAVTSAGIGTSNTNKAASNTSKTHKTHKGGKKGHKGAKKSKKGSGGTTTPPPK